MRYQLKRCPLIAFLIPSLLFSPQLIAQEIAEATLTRLKDATAFVKVQVGEAESSGSAFLIKKRGKEGYFITNAHVVEGPPSEIPAETFARGELCYTLGQKLNMPQLM